MSFETWLRPLQIICVLMILCSISLVHAQVPPVSTTTQEGEKKPSEVVIPKVSPDVASPRDTINTFLLNMEQLAEDKDNASANSQVLMTLDVPETLGKQRGAMMVQLLGIFNSLGRIDVETMAPGIDETKEKKLKRFEFFPDNPYPAASQMIERAISDVGSEPPAEIVLIVTESGEWKFSADTLTNLAKLWSWIEKRGAQFGVDVRKLVPSQMIRSRLVPEFLKGYFVLELELWQWVGLFIALFVAVFVDVMVRLALRPIARRMLFKSGAEIDVDTVRRTVRPFGLVAAVLVFWGALFLLAIVGVALLVLVVVAKLIFGFAVAWVAWSLIDLMAGAFLRRAEATESVLDNMFVPLLKRAVKLLIVAFALIYTSKALEVDIAPLLGSLGLAGLAISFAARDMIGNVFGGVTIFLDKPFKTGERILYQGYDGIVEKIGFRSTKVRTFNGHLVTIPNAGLTGDAVENASSRQSIRRIMNVRVPLKTPRQKLDQAVQLISEILAEEGIRERIHPVINGDLLEPRVYFNNIDADSLNIFVIYWFAPPDYWDYMEHTQRVNMRIMQEFEKAGLGFAMHAREFYLAGESRQKSMLGAFNGEVE